MCFSLPGHLDHESNASSAGRKPSSNLPWLLFCTGISASSKNSKKTSSNFNIIKNAKMRKAKAKENHQKLLCFDYDLWTKKALYTEKSLQARWKKERLEARFYPRTSQWLVRSSLNILFCYFLLICKNLLSWRHQKFYDVNILFERIMKSCMLIACNLFWCCSQALLRVCLDFSGREAWLVCNIWVDKVQNLHGDDSQIFHAANIKWIINETPINPNENFEFRRFEMTKRQLSENWNFR